MSLFVIWTMMTTVAPPRAVKKKKKSCVKIVSIGTWHGEVLMKRSQVSPGYTEWNGWV